MTRIPTFLIGIACSGTVAQASFVTIFSGAMQRWTGVCDVNIQQGPEDQTGDIENQMQQVRDTLQQANGQDGVQAGSAVVERTVSGVLGYVVLYLATTESPSESEQLCGTTCRYVGTFFAFCLLHALLQLKKEKIGHII